MVDLGPMEARAVKRNVFEGGTSLADTYTIRRFIGHGGMGEVYEASHARLSGRYAVKVIRRDVIELDPITVERFRREAEVMSSLRHPNIVQIIDFNETEDGSPFIVMEYLEGSDLQARMAQRGPMPVSEALFIVEQVASALAAAHDRGVVHRDLKPANIFLVPLPVAIAGNPTEFVKVLDFGISKVRSAGTLTGELNVMGTPHYMAPEQVRHEPEEIDGRCDQFALATVCYELLSGRKPFAGDTVEGVLFSVVHENPRSLASVVGEKIDKVLSTAMSKGRSKRYPSINTFVAALRAAALRSDNKQPGERLNVTFETGSPLMLGGAGIAAGAGANAPENKRETVSIRLSRRSALTASLVVGLGAIAVIAGLKVAGVLGGNGLTAAELLKIGADVRTRLEHAASEETRAVESLVRGAAKIPELRNAAAARIDSFSFNDLFATEEWWEPYRKLAAIVFEGEQALVTRGVPDVASASTWRFWASGSRGEPTAAFVLGEQQAYLAAGVTLEAGPFGLVLGKPLDETRLAQIAKNAGVERVLVSDGRRLLGLPGQTAGGPTREPNAELNADLRTLAGRETDAAIALSANRLAIATRVPGGLWLWGIVHSTPAAGS
jgi:serine/threonine protein kinase